MRYITVISKEVKIMDELQTNAERSAGQRLIKLNRFLREWYAKIRINNENNNTHPFSVIVNKEISDHISGWRFNILIAIIALTCFGSLYSA